MTIVTHYTSETLRIAWDALLVKKPKLRIRNAAAHLGVSEATLLSTGVGSTVTCLEVASRAGGWGDLLCDIEALGDVMALTRNDNAVHEKHGVYRSPEISGPIGLVLDKEIDLRVFLQSWSLGFAVRHRVNEAVWRRSLQFFDHYGQAVHKIFMTNESDNAAYDALVARYLSSDQTPLIPSSIPCRPKPAPETPDDEIDVEAFQRSWRDLKDTHEFFGVLRKFGLSRTQALRLAPEGWAREVDAVSLRETLQRVSAAELPVMVFVGSPGVIQIHSGPVRKLAVMGPWFNILDPRFNLHLREEGVASSWVVRKPTVDGVVTSLELFEAQGGTVAMFFGDRKPGFAENKTWREQLSLLTQSA